MNLLIAIFLGLLISVGIYYPIFSPNVKSGWNFYMSIVHPDCMASSISQPELDACVGAQKNEAGLIFVALVTLFTSVMFITNGATPM